jgi:small conductance mechanosensitive channel
MPILRRVLKARNIDVTVNRFIVLSVNVFLKVMLVISAIDLLGVQVLSFSAFLAAFGIGVGASVSGFIQNFFAGLILVGQQPCKSGDWIDIFGSVSGTLDTIGITHSTLKTPQGTQITVPNIKLIESCVSNYNAYEIMRADIECYIRHTENVQLVRELFFEACALESRIRSEPKPVMQVAEIGMHGIKVSMRMYTSQDDYWPVLSAMRELVKQQFERYGLQFQIERRELEFTPGPGIKMLATGSVDDEPCSDLPRQYRNAKPTADDLSKLHELNTHWDSLIDAIDNARTRAEEHHKRNHFAKPLKSLRRKFLFAQEARVEDSSEEQDDLVDTVLNYSKTALQTEAGEHVHQRDGLLGRRDYERRLKRRASKLRREGLSSSTSDHLNLGATSATTLAVPANAPRASSYHPSTESELKPPPTVVAAAAAATTTTTSATTSNASTAAAVTLAVPAARSSDTGVGPVRSAGFRSARHDAADDSGSGDNDVADIATQAAAVFAVTSGQSVVSGSKGK